jgi:hypothetical protein
MHAGDRMWSLQASAIGPHLLDAVGTEERSGLFVKSSTEQFHQTCVSAAVARHKKPNESHHG